MMIKLQSPPAAQTESTIALLWEKPQNSKEITAYKIYMDGKLQGICTVTDYTVTELAAESEHEFYIESVLQNGVTGDISNSIRVNTKPVSEIFDITSYGGVGDGKTVNTTAIQSAINACTNGGKVYIPKGVFVTGAIFLKSNMTLYLEEGSLLLGSTDTKDYPLYRYRFEGLETMCYASLLNTEDNSEERRCNITIEGLGKIDANGNLLRQFELKEGLGKPGRALAIRNCDNLYLKDITVRQSPAWCVHLIYCNQVSINNIKIHTKRNEAGEKYSNIANGDGLDPDSSSNVYIFHSTFDSQDDCIAIKSGRDKEGREVGIPSENYRITNCNFLSGFGVAIGSEMAGSIRNVLVQDCAFQDVYSIGSVKAPRGRGGVIENITFENIVFSNYSREHEDGRWFRGAIYIDQFYSHQEFDVLKEEAVNEGTSVIRNITFKDIVLDTIAGNAIYLTGLPESPLCNIVLENVNAIGKYGLKANNIRGFVTNNVSMTAREGETRELQNVVF
jgi:exo-poly-alpha-galacturonosidase